MGSTKTIARALRAAGVPLVTLSPGEFAVEEADLHRFLQRRQEEPAPAPPPKPRPKPTDPDATAGTTPNQPRAKKRRQ